MYKNIYVYRGYKRNPRNITLQVANKTNSLIDFSSLRNITLIQKGKTYEETNDPGQYQKFRGTP